MILSLKKIEIILLKEEAKEFLEKLQQFGVAEIISAQDKSVAEISDQKEKLELKLTELNFVTNFLKRFEPKAGFLQSLIPLKKEFQLSQIEDISNSLKIKEIIKECNNLEAGLNELESKKEKLAKQIETLEIFSGLTISKSQGDLKNFEYKIGSLKKEKKQGLLERLKKAGFAFYLEWAKVERQILGFAIIYPKERAQSINLILKEFEAKTEEILWVKPVDIFLEETKKELFLAQEEVKKQKARAEELAKRLPKLKALVDWFTWEKEKEEVFNLGARTKNYFSIKAWVPDYAFSRLKEEIAKTSPCFLLQEIPIETHEEPPVLMENKGPTACFRTVTDIYGAPKFTDPDPTPYLAPFFVAFFALSLSDSGYGLGLILISIFGKKFLKKFGFDRFFNILLIAGFFTIFAGLFTGTIFGTDIGERFRLLDPLKDPLGFLIFTLILGAFQVFTGIVIGLFWDIKHKGIREALAERGGSVAFFLALPVFALTRETMFLIGGIAFLPLFKIVFSKENNFFLRVGKGLGSLYGLSGYFSDILSYSRLLALGLATGIIGMVVNKIAFLFKDMSPFASLGYLIAGITLIGGHTFNLLINTLGAFIHSARLQFVEFFPKFIEGGGRYFKPFAKKGRFIEIINN